MVGNTSFCHRRTNRTHKAPKYGPVKSKFEFDYYIQKYCCLEELAHIRIILEKEGQEVMYYSKGCNSNYMEVFGYESHDKLIWTSVKGCRNTNTISKQGISKRNMNIPSGSFPN